MASPLFELGLIQLVVQFAAEQPASIHLAVQFVAAAINAATAIAGYAAVAAGSYVIDLGEDLPNPFCGISSIAFEASFIEEAAGRKGWTAENPP